MGNPSELRFTPALSAAVPINWSNVPEASKKFFQEGWATDWRTDKKRPLPATIGKFAKMLDESKFFGYMDPERSTLLLDISEFGLTPSNAIRESSAGFPVGPHFYMKYLDQIWFVLLVPGKRDGIIGFSPKMPYLDDQNEQIARDNLRVAEDYETKFWEEVSQWGTLGAVSRKKVPG